MFVIFFQAKYHYFVIHAKAGKHVPKHYNMKTYGGSLCIQAHIAAKPKAKRL
jgi:hypothetical protein